jgi:hypothetical protein
MKRFSFFLLVTGAVIISASAQAHTDQKTACNAAGLLGASSRGPSPSTKLMRWPSAYRATRISETKFAGGANPSASPNDYNPPPGTKDYTCTTDNGSCAVRTSAPKHTGDSCRCGGDVGSID